MSPYDIELHIAPMQGYTQAPWRHFRREVYGGVWPEYTPFMRIERGEVRTRDLRDFSSPLNEGSKLTPQVIFRDIAELSELVDALTDLGATSIDLNCGCPYPPQVHRGRGAGVLLNPELMSEVAAYVRDRSDLEFSLKMRLGVDSPDDWREIYPIVNRMPLRHVAVHPRIARQQYRGDLYLDQFRDLLEYSENPVIFNGDILTPGDIREVTQQFPSVIGVMTGRGICGRPSLFTEFVQERDWSRDEQIAKIKEFHHLLLEYYRENLSGDGQILQHIKPFWEYTGELIGRKALKAIAKSTRLNVYLSAVATI